MSYNSSVLMNHSWNDLENHGKILILGPTQGQSPEPPEAAATALIRINYVKLWSGWGTVVKLSLGVHDLDSGYLLKFCTLVCLICLTWSLSCLKTLE